MIDFPSLECACYYSFPSDWELGGDNDASSRGFRGVTCRAGDRVSWVLSVSGLVPRFLYKLHFMWYLADEQLGAFDSVISTTSSSYVVRTPLTESGRNGASTFDLIAHSKELRMDVAVWDMYPGLTVEDALIGARHMDSAVNTVRAKCVEQKSGFVQVGAPVWLLPEAGSLLCPDTILLVSGLQSALERYPGLFPAADLDGNSLNSLDMLESSNPTYVSLSSGLHTLSLELINKTTDGASECCNTAC